MSSTSDWAPTVSGVGALLRARTKQARTGAELGTFTNADAAGNGATRPTADEVTELLETAADDVADVIGSDLPPAFWDRASRLTELRAALLVELSYFPEQVGSQRSNYNQLLALYNDRLNTLKTNIADYAGTDTEGTQPGMSPHFHFPENKGGLIGWRTRW